VTTSQHRSSRDRWSRWRPVPAAYECQTHFPNLRRTPQKLRRRSDPWATPHCPHVASSTCLSSERIRPTPSHQQVFRRLGPRPRASGPTMAEVPKVGQSDWVRLWRIQNRGDSSRLLLCQRSCIRIPATFLRASERSLPGCGIPQPEWWSPRTTMAITHSTRPSSWGLCSPARYKMLTTQDMTGLSGIP